VEPPTTDLVNDLFRLAELWSAADAYAADHLLWLGQSVAAGQLGGWLDVDVFQMFDPDSLEARSVALFRRLHWFLVGLDLFRKLLVLLVIPLTAAALWAAAVSEYAALDNPAPSVVLLLLFDILLFTLWFAVALALYGGRLLLEARTARKTAEWRRYAAQVLRRASLFLAQERYRQYVQPLRQSQEQIRMLLERWIVEQTNLGQPVRQSTAMDFPADSVVAARQLSAALERLPHIEKSLAATMHLSAQIADDFDHRDEQIRTLAELLRQTASAIHQAIDRLGALNEQTQALLNRLSQEGEHLAAVWKQGHQIWLEQIEAAAEHTAGTFRAQGVEIHKTGEAVREGLQRLERAYTELQSVLQTRSQEADNL